MTGQDAVNVAEQFAEAVDFDGVLMSKLDGDARGGAALSAKAVTGKPILFASVGEKLDQLERFHPERMAQRILGMGDVMSLIEKAERQFEEDEAQASSSASCAATSSRSRTSSSSSRRCARWGRCSRSSGCCRGCRATSSRR